MQYIPYLQVHAWMMMSERRDDPYTVQHRKCKYIYRQLTTETYLLHACMQLQQPPSYVTTTLPMCCRAQSVTLMLEIPSSEATAEGRYYLGMILWGAANSSSNNNNNSCSGIIKTSAEAPPPW